MLNLDSRVCFELWMHIAAGKQRCFNVHLTSYGCCDCYMNVVLTFCIGWDSEELLVVASLQKMIQLPKVDYV